MNSELEKRFVLTRKATTDICDPLEIEDFAVQPAPEVSPPKWHLGHTTWFFEEIILTQHAPNYVRFNPDFRILLNSYYKSMGTHWLQYERGHLSRPTVTEILKYRAHVNENFSSFLTHTNLNDEVKFLVELGIQHEQQHQELLLMDIKFILGSNPLETRYCQVNLPAATRKLENNWAEFNEGIYKVGACTSYFSFDNENPRHKNYIYPFSISKTLVSSGEYLDFINDNGYARPELWLSQGWEWVQKSNPANPLYWKKKNGSWCEYTLHGSRPLDLDAPLTHINYFEADAYANWKKCRLPTEQEVEIYSESLDTENSEFEIKNDVALFHPINISQNRRNLWCWTKSQYTSYPGYKNFQGAVQEYNGKFMCNQFVLRGGCFATPKNHYRDSYRNFYLPHQQWMFSGIRLAQDAK